MSKQKEYYDLEMADAPLKDDAKVRGNETKSYNEPAPTIGYEFVPPEGTQPQPILMQKLNAGIMKMINESGSQYNGETNSNGQRHGKGRLTYIDGSFYEGNWVNGKKEGFGLSKSRDGIQYEGNWLNDMKNGEGVLTLPSGAKIQTTWKDDKKNGRGYATNEKGVRGDVEFFEDILVSKSDQNPDCYNWAPLNIILALCVFGLAYYIKNGNYKDKNRVGLWILLILLYIAYVVEGAMCRTYRFITTIIQSQKASELIADQKSKAPKVTFWLSNYHYEWRHRSGKHRYERVTSSSFQRELRFAEYFDKSPDSNSISHMKNHNLTRLDFGLNVDYSAQASQSRACQEHDFKQEKINDTHYDFDVRNSIDGFEESLLVHNNINGSGLPWYTNTTIYWIFHLLFLGWLFRIIFVCNSMRVSFNFEKFILK